LLVARVTGSWQEPFVNRSTAVIGISNVFDVTGDLESAWAASAAVAAASWGELPIVGYDSADSLEAAIAPASRASVNSSCG